jgi:hypothetical protein
MACEFDMNTRKPMPVERAVHRVAPASLIWEENQFEEFPAQAVRR